jgi:hypothetical protein
MKGGSGVEKENAWIAGGQGKSLSKLQKSIDNKYMRLVFVNTDTATGKGVIWPLHHRLFNGVVVPVILILLGELEAFMFEKKFEERMQEHPGFKNVLNGTGGGGGGFCKGVREALRGKIRFTGGAVVLALVGTTTKWTATSKRPRGEAGPEASASKKSRCGP